MDKRGFELSVSFIVILIITLVVFAFGIRFAYTLFNKSEELVKQFDEQTEREIEQILFAGNIVAIPHDVKETNTRQTVYFALGILNELNTAEGYVDFKPHIRFATAVDIHGEEIDAPISASDWTLDEYPAQKIKTNEHKIIGLAFRPPGSTIKGTYAFNVNVCYNDDNPANNDPEIVSAKCSDSYPDLYDYTHPINIIVK